MRESEGRRSWRRSESRGLLPAAAVVAVASAIGCGSAERAREPVEETGASATPSVGEEGHARGNVLENPSFEAGREPWSTMGGQAWGAFEIVDHPVRSGLAAALLPVRAAAGEDQKVRVYGVVQEPRPEEFPERLAGWYRVESWQPAPPPAKTYLQAVVIVWGDPRAQELVGARGPISNYQIRYYLAGVTEPPFLLANAKYKFLGRGAPVVGEWVRFETDLRRDFQELWGVVPEDYQFLRVLFEARWDDRRPSMPVHADVVYDDLWLGADVTGRSIR